MQKKTNPSLEVVLARNINLGLGGNTVSEVREVAAIVP